MDSINKAQSQVDDIEAIAKSAVNKQLKNLDESKQLLEKSQNMTGLAHEFQKDAHRMEQI